MQELKELIDRFINVKSKSLLLQNELKDLNCRSHYSQIETLYNSTQHICANLLEKINGILFCLDASEITEMINEEKKELERKYNEYQYYKYDNSKYYIIDAYEYLIKYLSQYKLSLK